MSHIAGDKIEEKDGCGGEVDGEKICMRFAHVRMAVKPKKTRNRQVRQYLFRRRFLRSHCYGTRISALCLWICRYLRAGRGHTPRMHPSHYVVLPETIIIN
ncbi:hypothetical protein RUM43_008016 [Polyplax serrata]|uniref:Uncharacterized protein n=1 Tax=Polyplax serrata TaxID=468196 RepID=A0AAN8PN79_POLSC